MKSQHQPTAISSALDRLDRYLLVNHPVLWSKLDLELHSVWVPFVSLALAALGAVVFPLPTHDVWSPTTVTLCVALGLGGLNSVRLGARGLPSERPLRDEKHSVPNEGFRLCFGHWLLVAGQTVLSAVPLLLIFPTVTAIVRYRTQDIVSDQALIGDLNAINSGVESCCVLQPSSEACLKGRIIPMSSEQVRAVREARPDFITPTSFRQDPSADHISRVAALQRALRRYAKVDESGALPWFYQMRVGGRLKDLDRSSQEDNRTPTQRTCAEISARDLRFADLNVSRILDAKHLTPSSPLQNEYWYFDAVLLALLLGALGELGVGGWVALGIFFGVAVGFLDLFARNFSVRIEYLFWFLSVLALIGACRIALGQKPWLRIDAPNNGGGFCVLFPVFVIAARSLSGLKVYGHVVDWIIVGLALLVAVRYREMIETDLLEEAAEPPRVGGD